MVWQQESTNNERQAERAAHELRRVVPFGEGGGYRAMEEASRARPYLDVSSTAAAAAAAAHGSARRQQLVNWMMLLQLRLGLQAETLHLGVCQVDVFLAHQGHAAKFLMGNAAAVASGSRAGASLTIRMQRPHQGKCPLPQSPSLSSPSPAFTVPTSAPRSRCRPAPPDALGCCVIESRSWDAESGAE